MQHGVFGERLGQAFRQVDPPTLVSNTRDGHVVAVTEVWHDGDDYGLTEPIARDDAYLIGLQLRPMTRHELWVDGRPVRVDAFGSGTVAFRDLRRNPVAYMDQPFHSLQFYMPRSALLEIAEEIGQRGVTGLEFGLGDYVRDDTLHHLGKCLLPVMHGSGRANQLFVDQMMLALRNHVVSTYGGHAALHALPRGTLAPWRQRRAMEMLSAHLATGIGLVEVAQACGLSQSAFIRQFHRSIGCSPHQWLMLRRVDRAIDLMRDRSLSLAEIASACGFADQSHFTRVFRGRMGTSPATWRSGR
jgi:AraC family transcriptional regulator